MKVIKQKKFFGALAILVSFVMVSSVFTFVEGNGGLNADFYWEPEEPTDIQNIHFYDDSSGGAIVWVWDFGDGNSSCDPNPFHVYGDDGVYTVRLTVWDDSSSMDTITKDVVVSNVPPVADAGDDKTINNLTVLFNASLSYDVDGSITVYSWNFGDSSTGSGIIRGHTYSHDGTYTVVLNVTDDDVAYDEDTVQIIVDTESPQTNITLDGNLGTDGWYSGNVTVTLDPSDSLSGVNATFYKTDGNWNIYNVSFVISAEGENDLNYYSVDNASNNEVVKSATVKIDNVYPRTNFSINGTLGDNEWYVGNVTVTLNASDALSGVNYTKYKLDDGDWKEYVGEVNVGSSGSHTFYLYSVDNAGNVEAESNFTFKIDKNAPSVSITVPKDGYLYIFGRDIMPTAFGKTKIIGKITAVAAAADTLSGVQSVCFKLDGDILWMDFNAPYEVNLPRAHPRGVYTLTVTAYDDAGNSATTTGVDYIKIL